MSATDDFSWQPRTDLYVEGYFIEPEPHRLSQPKHAFVLNCSGNPSDGRKMSMKSSHFSRLKRCMVGHLLERNLAAYCGDTYRSIVPP